MLDHIFLVRKTNVAPAAMLVQPQTAEKQAPKKETNIFTSFKLFILFSQILGILPQENANKKMNEMHFKWCSWRILYSFIVITSFSVAVMCCLLHWVRYGSTIKSMATGVFYGGSLATTILYFHLAISWSKLMKSWYSVDKIMNIHYGYPVNRDKKIKLFSAIFLTLGIADYLLSVGNRYEYLYNTYGENTSAMLYFNDSFPELFAYIPYSIGTAIFCTIITVFSNLTWALNDLFIIITSITLAMRFMQITQKLKKECDNPKNTSLLFWQQIREDYDRLASFCKELDSYISPIVLLSYFLNIFFLLIQLYYSLEFMPLPFRKIYCIFSFGYLIFKTTIVSLYAAWINDESKAPTSTLNSVDTSLYNVEIRRLLIQISFDKTALTGCKMFSVKRGIVLSVASAIVTYELVLIQFSQANLYDTVS